MQLPKCAVDYAFNCLVFHFDITAFYRMHCTLVGLVDCLYYIKVNVNILCFRFFLFKFYCLDFFIFYRFYFLSFL